MVAVTFDSVKELMAKTEQERRDELVHNDVKLKESQAICHVLGLPEKGLKAELLDRIAMCHGVVETESRDDRFRSPHAQSRVATNLRAAAFHEVPILPGSQGVEAGSNSAAASGSSSAQEPQPHVVPTASAAEQHDNFQHNRAAAASLAPGSLGPPPPGPTNTAHTAIPPPQPMPFGSPTPLGPLGMAVDAAPQPTPPPVAAAARSVGLSPVVLRHKEKFRQFIDRDRQPLPPLNTVPPMPASDSAAALQPLVDGMNTLIVGVNELRQSLSDTVKLKDLQEFREMQSEELREMVVVHTEPLRQDLEEHNVRIGALESKVENLKANGDEAVRKRMMDDVDPAFRQIAVTNFKVSDLKQRVKLLERFAATNFPDIKVANIETIMNGPWKGRKPTNTTVIEFFSRDARDQALAISKDRKVFDGGVPVPDLKIERARTRAQRARNWALRKAEELAKVEAQRRGIRGSSRIDFAMPVRKVFVGDELAFAQQKDELRGTFVDVFAACVLPP